MHKTFTEYLDHKISFLAYCALRIMAILRKAKTFLYKTGLKKQQPFYFPEFDVTF